MNFQLSLHNFLFCYYLVYRLLPGILLHFFDRQDNNKTESYVGLTENSFKTRYNNHTSSFRNQSKRHNTTLSQYIWSLKDQNIPYTLKWKILAKGRPYTTSTKSCNLCLMEKYLIICKPHLATLNIRNELSSECRHKKKHLLCNFQPTHSWRYINITILNLIQ